MRIANLDGRLSLLVADDRAIDVAAASGGRFEPEPQAIFERWDEFRGWAASARADGARPFSRLELGPPVPAPRQIFAIGMNYAMHANEIGLAPPERPPVFTKFASSIAGPYASVEHPGGAVDWEVELVVAIG